MRIRRYLKNILRNIRPTLLLLRRQDAAGFGDAFFPDGQPLGYALAVRLVDWSDGGEIILDKPFHIIKVQQDGAGDTVAQAFVGIIRRGCGKFAINSDNRLETLFRPDY